MDRNFRLVSIEKSIADLHGDFREFRRELLHEVQTHGEQLAVFRETKVALDYHLRNHINWKAVTAAVAFISLLVMIFFKVVEAWPG